MKNWTNWKPMPAPADCRKIEGPDGSGVYQVMHRKTKENIFFGIGVKCRKRMKSFFPAPYGTGKRNNADKRKYVLNNWQHLVYRTLETKTRPEAKQIEDKIKAQNYHKFNT